MVGSLTTVKMCRGDQSPWGFRLQGGKDWGSPLVVSKVNPGSLAEQGGLQIGDHIISIQTKSTDGMLHKDAQDTIMKAGNNLEIQIERGGTTIWKPKVTKVEPKPVVNDEPQLFTKTSLTKDPAQETQKVGGGFNAAPKPFLPPGSVLVHKQFNSPLNIYSMKSIEEAIQAHSEVIAPGVTGINFMKPDAPVNKDSAVYRAILEEETQQKGEYHHHHHPVESTETDHAQTLQSHAFRKIQQSLIDEDRKTPQPPQVSPRSAFPAHPMNKQSALSPTGTAGKAPAAHAKPASVPASVPAPAPAPSENANPNANICSECGRLIIGVFCKIKDKSLHAECFKCSTCGTSLKNIGYFNVNEKLYCDVHAKQAAKVNIPPTSNFEPITIKAGASNGTLSPNLSSPKITIPVQAGSPQPSGMPSPSVISAMPWHSPIGVHHVNAPNSPGKLSNIPPPVAPKPKYRPVSSPSSLYQSHPQPYTGPPADVHRTNPSSVKFSWPPPKISSLQGVEMNGQQECTQSNSSLLATIGSQQISETNKVTTDSRSSFYSSSQTSVSQQMGQTSQISQSVNQTLSQLVTQAAGTHPVSQQQTQTQTQTQSQSLNTGSRTAPRRGRGQLKQQGAPGSRVPICSSCGSPIRGPFVCALGKSWCPEHFICANDSCKRNLEDVGFVEEKGKLYCENCFESYLAPICAKCNIRIKGDTLMALEKQWHPECFICSYCKKPFGNSSFYLEDGNPYCEKDWNDLFTTKCVGCGFAIEAGDRWVEALNSNYHSQCFKCSVCSKNLEGQSFYAKGGRPYCKSHAR